VAFLAAVPVALGTFLLAWFLKEIPLRTTLAPEAGAVEGAAVEEDEHAFAIAEF
jgi:hypothetical protein